VRPMPGRVVVLVSVRCRVDHPKSMLAALTDENSETVTFGTDFVFGQSGFAAMILEKELCFR
jgi:hypothetical protein